MADTKLPVVDFDELKKTLSDPAHIDDMWLGRGFAWGQTQTQRASELLARDWHKVYLDALGIVYPLRYFREHWLSCLVNPFAAYHHYKEIGKRICQEQGAKWLHGLGDSEEDLFQPHGHTEGHTLIVGTTGSGKTRCLDLLISQAVLRNETVFIIDPKGDADLRDKARRACEALGQASRFVSFHPAFPQESIRINPLANFTRHTEIADRIASLLPSQKDSDPFKSFGFGALNAVCYAVTLCNRHPTIRNLKHYLSGTGNGAFATLVVEALTEFFRQRAPEVMVEVKRLAGKFMDDPEKHSRELIKLYHSLGSADSDMDDLINQCLHNQEHFSKMIGSLLPILTMLSSGQLGDMLSPSDREIENVNQVWLDTKMMIDRNMVVYIGLDSLSDPMVGSAIGALILSDLACAAGAEYNFGESDRFEIPGSTPTTTQKIFGAVRQKAKEVFLSQTPSRPKKRVVNIFVDEAAEVVNTPFLQLLNKGRGAGMKLFVATQTIADFESRMGSKSKAVQLLGNLNNRLSLRCIDPDTQMFIAGAIPKTRIASVERMQGVSTSAYEPVPKGGISYGTADRKGGAAFCTRTARHAPQP